jgi:cysteinyl-tRNA synthetase
MKLLGQTLDIHGGGLDLQFPHHENELAQSESYTAKPFARYWMHNGLMKMGTAKMAGSVGNVINVADLLRQHTPETVRFLLLGTHYRSPIEYSEERLQEVRRSLEAFYRFFERFQRITGESFHGLQAPATRAPFEDGGELLAEVGRLRDEFLGQMDDDFNTGGAIGTLYKLLPVLNRYADARRLEEGRGQSADLQAFRRGAVVLKELSQILGLFAAPPAGKDAGQDDQLLAGLMQLFIDLRAEARKAKNFALADQIRKRLAELGVTLEDRPGGTIWRRAEPGT